MRFTNSPFKPCTLHGLNNKANSSICIFYLVLSSFPFNLFDRRSLQFTQNTMKCTKINHFLRKHSRCRTLATVLQLQNKQKVTKLLELCILSIYNLKQFSSSFERKASLCSLLQNSDVTGYHEQNTRQVHSQSPQCSLRNRNEPIK